ncbi:AAA family ATPase [Planomonospora venezuelensis]|uniref:AAA+ ATPase domain-containing protein n=1 Tax=Planomonospora venezuelensis TaxID=1999 RepID=A0A841D384_PLAVE|nr:ATP-binding protein [Planomonospora venezuelensis]MBB5962848.1 hypothetical protein [Planomonospora venezuelensis]GIM99356.1 ATP-binding protein [Planomonospora venezuelensis]
MYVANLQISGVRGFSGSRQVDLDFTRPDGSFAGWTVLAGRNGSGKTTLLQAIALAVSGPRNPIGSFADLWLGATAEPVDAGIRVKLTYDLADDAADDLFTYAGYPDPIWSTLQWGQDGLPSWPQDDTRLYTLWSPKSRGWFLAGYGPFRRLSNPEIGRPGTGRWTHHQTSRTLFNEDEPLVEGVSWLVEQHLYRLEKRPKAIALLDSVLRLLADGLLPDGLRIRHVDSDGLWVQRGSKEVPLRQMSDGYRTVTALVLDIVRQLHGAYGSLEIEERDDVPTLPYPGVVLIDEVDAHLHVSWQQKIGEWLKTHFPKIQFIVTTHSPYICQSASPGGLIRLPGPDEQAPPAVADEDLYRRIVYGSGDDAIVTELFGVDSPYSPRADELREDLGDLEIKVLEGTATPVEAAEYRRLSTELKSSPATRVREVSRALGDDS